MKNNLNESLLTDTFYKSHKIYNVRKTNPEKEQILKFIYSAIKPVDNMKKLYKRFIELASNEKIVQINRFNYATPTCKEIMILIMKNLELSRHQMELYKVTCTEYDNFKIGILISSIKGKSVLKKLRLPLESCNINSEILEDNLLIKYELNENEFVYLAYDPIRSLVGLIYRKIK